MISTQPQFITGSGGRCDAKSLFHSAMYGLTVRSAQKQAQPDLMASAAISNDTDMVFAIGLRAIALYPCEILRFTSATE